MSTDIAILAEIPMFELIDEQERQTLSELLDSCTFSKGETIFSQGDAGDSLFVVRQGRVQAIVTSDDGQVVLRGDAWELPLAPANAARARASSSGEVILGVRHGHVRVLPDSAGQGIPGRLYTVEPTGDVTFVHVYLGSSLLVASTTETFRGAPDEPVRLEFDQAHIYLFDRASGVAL